MVIRLLCINGGHGDAICMAINKIFNLRVVTVIFGNLTSTMPRTKPTLKLGVYGSFDINPEQAVTSFFESKLQDELY